MVSQLSPAIIHTALLGLMAHPETPRFLAR